MSALGTVVRAGVGRRRVQTLVMVLTTTMAVTASVLAAGLLVASQGPFDHAFAKQHGAQLAVQFDAARATAAQVTDTARLSSVTAAAGPYRTLTLTAQVGAHGPGSPQSGPELPPGIPLPPITVVGRADPGGAVDDLVLTAGKWATGTGQIVLDADQMPVSVGDTLTFPDVRGKPSLTVVGVARSISRSARAWVSPAEVTALTSPGTVPGYQMLYRFTRAATNAQVAADRAAIARAVPPGSMAGASSYLTVKLAADRSSATFVPFVVAFGVLGLLMSILIIGIVVSGAVGAATRRIGILKALGFTPAQVVRAYLGQALIPATVGTGLGLVAGNLLAVLVLSTAETAYQTGTLTVAPWIDVAVPAAALAAVAATALIPARRAGRLRTVDAIAVGRTPSTGRGRVVRRLLGRLPLPRPVSLGLANPFARPARTATIAAALAFGTIGVTFGVGLALSLNGIQNGVNRENVGDVLVEGYGPPIASAPPPAAPPGAGPSPAGTRSTQTQLPTSADPVAVGAKIRAQPGTQRYFSTAEVDVAVAGLTGTTSVIAYQGDSSWGSLQLIAGSWFSGPGQADVPTGFLAATGTHLGDLVTLTNDGHTAAVRIVGEVLDLHQEGMVILTDAASLTGLHAAIVPPSVQFDVDLKPGTSRQAYVDSLNTALRSLGFTAQPNSTRLSATVVAMDSLAAMLTVMLVAVAGLGVLNTVLLDTRERVHDFGVFKALGMSPRQTITMVLTSVAGIGLLAGVIGVPIGVGLHDYVLPVMGHSAGTRIPTADLEVYRLPLLALLVLGGLVIATVGALPPAGWAARTGTATALHTE